MKLLFIHLAAISRNKTIILVGRAFERDKSCNFSTTVKFLHRVSGLLSYGHIKAGGKKAKRVTALVEHVIYNI